MLYMYAVVQKNHFDITKPGEIIDGVEVNKRERYTEEKLITGPEAIIAKNSEHARNKIVELLPDEIKKIVLSDRDNKNVEVDIITVPFGN